jgi:hypothetical protein
MKLLPTVGMLAILASACAAPVLAQDTSGPMTAPMTAPDEVPAYTDWQAGWDNRDYDHKHVILGTVADFKPFRLAVSRPDGPTQTIDLKNGTTILPNGMTPMLNQRVAVVGYYSNGTFIANRVILRR